MSNVTQNYNNGITGIINRLNPSTGISIKKVIIRICKKKDEEMEVGVWNPPERSIGIALKNLYDKCNFLVAIYTHSNKKMHTCPHYIISPKPHNAQK